MQLLPFIPENGIIICWIQNIEMSHGHIVARERYVSGICKTRVLLSCSYLFSS